MPQQEGEQLLPRPHQVHGSIYPRSDQIAQRFVSGVWDPHGRQIPRTMKNRQLLRILPIGLDPLARLAWDHGRRGHGALVPEASNLAIDAITTTACFVAEVELAVPGKLLRHLAYSFRSVRDRTDEPHWPTPAVFSNANGDGRLMDVHTDE
jgi:hypothetical protein